MMAVPIKVNDDEFDVMLVLEQENLDRIREHDPAELITSHFGMPWNRWRMRNIMVAFLAEEEREEFVRRVKENPKNGLRWLSRGFRYRPEAGDHDENYRRMTGG